MKDRLIFAGTESSGLYRSADGGTSWTRVGEDRIAEVVNGIVLGSNFGERPSLLVLSPDPLISSDGGTTWSTVLDLPQEASGLSVAAPHGLDVGAPLLVGLDSGGVLRMVLSWEEQQ